VIFKVIQGNCYWCHSIGHIAIMCLSCTVSEILLVIYQNLYIGAPLAVTIFEFQQDLWHQKTSPMAVLRCCLRMLHLILQIERRLVADKQTYVVWLDRNRAIAYIMALRGKII